MAGEDTRGGVGVGSGQEKQGGHGSGPVKALCQQNGVYSELANQVIKGGNTKGDPICKQEARNLGEQKRNHHMEERK